MDSLRVTEQEVPKLQRKYIPRRVPQRQVSGDRVLVIGIVAAIPFETNAFRWRYQWEEYEVSDGEFQPRSDGVTWESAGWALALNTEEWLNDEGATGSTGYGVPNVPGPDQTVQPIPLPVGAVTTARVVTDAVSGNFVPVLNPSTNALLIDCGTP
jgi:hypothetical protein